MSIARALTAVGTAVAMTLIAALGSWADAAIINVSIDNAVSAPNGYGTGVGQLLAPVAYTGTTWNNNGTSGTNLTASDGSATTVDFSLASSAAGGGSAATNAWMDVLSDYRYRQDAAMTFTLTGLTSGQTYDLHMIMQGNNSEGGVIAMTSGAAVLPTSATSTGLAPRSTATAYVSGTNYASQTWLANATTATFTISPEGASGADRYATIAGFQLVAVPEPGSFAIVGAGAAAVLLLSRRRRG